MWKCTQNNNDSFFYCQLILTNYLELIYMQFSIFVMLPFVMYAATHISTRSSPHCRLTCPLTIAPLTVRCKLASLGYYPQTLCFATPVKSSGRFGSWSQRPGFGRGKIVEVMHYSCCTEGNLWDVASTCSCARPLYTSVLVKLCSCEFVYSCIYVFLYLCICAI